ncbi:MAG: alpha/beta hydrolase [Bacteroidia bacterium]|jgi:pimeloyl-ACP methyl ester carboxylesterase|nr:alpha/beta hydrolase [Bacteroidia bacterium]
MKNIFLILLLIGFSSCLKLDSNLYNNDNTIQEYLLDNYTGEQDFVLDASYDISPSLIYKFSLASKAPEDASAFNIQAIYIGDQNRINTDTVIVYCHGNKWHMDFYWQRAKLLANTGGKNRFGVLMFDYRGFGLSEGEPTEEGMYADTKACLAWLKSKGLSDERLVMYGFSLGSAPACELTANPEVLKPTRIILEAPFGSAEVMVQDASQLNMPAAYFTDLKIDNAEEIRKVKQPFLWLHGLNDLFLNYKTHGEVVYKNYKGVFSRKIMVEAADHGEIPEKIGFEDYSKNLEAFIIGN